MPPLRTEQPAALYGSTLHLEKWSGNRPQQNAQRTGHRRCPLALKILVLSTLRQGCGDPTRLSFQPRRHTSTFLYGGPFFTPNTFLSRTYCGRYLKGCYN